MSDRETEAQELGETQTLHFDRFTVTGYAVEANTVNVGIFNADDTQARVAVTVSDDSETIYVYAAGGREVHVMRYEDYYGLSAADGADAEAEEDIPQ